MTSIDDLRNDVKNIGDKHLGDLDPEDRLRVFIKEAAEGREERLSGLPKRRRNTSIRRPTSSIRTG